MFLAMLRAALLQSWYLLIWTYMDVFLVEGVFCMNISIYTFYSDECIYTNNPQQRLQYQLQLYLYVTVILPVFHA